MNLEIRFACNRVVDCHPDPGLRICAGRARAADLGGAVELRYRGTFSKASRDAEPTGEPVKRFDLYCLSTPRPDGGRDRGLCSRRARGRRRGPGRPGSEPWRPMPGCIRERTGCDSCTSMAERPTRSCLPFPYFEFAKHLAGGARWEANRPAELPSQNDTAPWKYRVSARTKVGERDCWRVDVSNNFGPQESLWIDVSQPLLVKAERRIVIGRGEVHLLKMELDSVTPLSRGRARAGPPTARQSAQAATAIETGRRRPIGRAERRPAQARRRPSEVARTAGGKYAVRAARGVDRPRRELAIATHGRRRKPGPADDRQTGPAHPIEVARRRSDSIRQNSPGKSSYSTSGLTRETHSRPSRMGRSGFSTICITVARNWACRSTAWPSIRACRMPPRRRLHCAPFANCKAS